MSQKTLASFEKVVAKVRFYPHKTSLNYVKAKFPNTENFFTTAKSISACKHQQNLLKCKISKE